jgi:pyruvate/2-oxoglutarate dehydrogenase complex dihydrolipoamide acyltransferase (E2) component
MSTEILIPKLSFTMTDGTVAQWLVADGASVTEGQVLFELDAEKATQEIEAPASGVLSIVVEAGVEVPVGTVIGKIG